MTPQNVCPTHGEQYYRFHEKYGAGCSFKAGVGHPGMNANGYCNWKPANPGNGSTTSPRPAGPSAPRSNYVPDPAKDRSIVAQVAMKVAAELYGPAFSIAPKDERDNLLAEMITSALRINQNIHRMSEPAPKPQPKREPVNTWTNDEPSFPDDEDAQRWQS